MTPEQERWAEAATVHRQHGGRAPAYVAERVGAFAAIGDMEGVERWREIAARLDQLMRPGSVQ